MGRVTIKDIAEKTGLSKTAISFAFNSPDRLPEATVKRILHVAWELGYNPDPIARSMSTGKTGSIGFLIPQSIPAITDNPFFNQLMAGIGEICTETNHTLLLVPPFEGSMSKAVSSAVVDGFITLGLEVYQRSMQVIQNRRVPFVVIDSDEEEGIYSINVDDRKGAYQGMKHLLDLGHRNILSLCFSSFADTNIEDFAGALKRRTKGYQDALTEAGLKLKTDTTPLASCDVSISAAKETFTQQKKKHPGITAVACMSDVQALGVMEAAKEMGLKIPEDLSVIGFDDIPQAERALPPLTTVHQPTREKGKRAAAMLEKLIRQDKSQVKNVILDTHLVERDSTAKL